MAGQRRRAEGGALVHQTLGEVVHGVVGLFALFGLAGHLPVSGLDSFLLHRQRSVDLFTKEGTRRRQRRRQEISSQEVFKRGWISVQKAVFAWFWSKDLRWSQVSLYKHLLFSVSVTEFSAQSGFSPGPLVLFLKETKTRSW